MSPASASATGALAPSGADRAAAEAAVEPLELIAEHLGVDVSAKGIFRSVLRAVDRLGASDAGGMSDAVLIWQFSQIDFGGHAPGSDKVKAIGDRLAGEIGRYLLVRSFALTYPLSSIGAAYRFVEGSDFHLVPGERESLSGFVRMYLNDLPQTAKVDKLEFERVSKELPKLDLSALRLAQLQAHAADRGVDVALLVATMPDPIDSYVGWYFDPLMDAFRRGVEARGFVMDRFYFPDWSRARGSPAEPTATPTRTLHERHPALLLFRNASRPASLLLTMIIFETPTGGLHHAAFRRAMDFVAVWDGSGSTVRIVGPCFSGTTPSLKVAIANAADLDLNFRVVTGVATAPANRDIGTFPRTTFEATILDKGTLNAGLEGYLRDRILGEDLTTGSRYAQVRESNTAYGDQARPATPGHDAAAPHNDTPLTEFARGFEITFPLHISRLRAADKQPAAAPSPSGQSGSRSLALQDSAVATDRLPAMMPALADGAAELMLKNVLRSIASEPIDVVGIVATDARDTLFLTQELRRVSPNAVIYSLESDLLLTHPDFRAATRGMVVASTYPLYNRSQLWTHPRTGASRRDLFYSSVAQGVFNAVVLQLGRQPDSDARRSVNASEANSPTVSGQFLLDYAFPLEPCSASGCAPPIWINVVGRDRFWPVRVYPQSSATTAGAARPAGADRNASPYVALVRTAENAAPGVLVQAFQWWDGLVWASTGFVIILLCHASPFRFGRRAVAQSGRHRSSYFDRFAWQLPESNRLRSESWGMVKHLMACAIALLLVSTYFTALTGTSASQGTVAYRTLHVLLTVISGALAIGVIVMGALFLLTALGRARSPCRDPKSPEGRLNTHAIADTIKALAVIGTGTWALICYGAFLIDITSSEHEINAWLWCERSVHVFSGVSPALPVLALGAALYLWGFTGLKREGPTQPMLDATVPERPATLDERLHFFSRIGDYTPDPLDRQRCARWCAGVAAGVVLGSIVVLPRGILSHEGLDYAAMYRWGSTAIEILIATSVVSMWFQWRWITARLCRLEEHPLLKVFADSDRLPERLITPRNVVRTPTVEQIYPLARRADELSRDPDVDTPVQDACKKVWDAFKCEASGCGGNTWSHGRMWKDLHTLMCHLTTELQTALTEVKAPAVAHAARAFQHVTDMRAFEVKLSVTPGESNSQSRRSKLTQEIVALHLAFTLREVLTKLADRAVFVLAAVCLLLASHTLFPFGPHRTLVSLAWINVLVAVGLSLTGIMHLERNIVVSRMSGSTPGQVEWSSTLVWRIVLFGVGPLLSLLAAEYPGLVPAIGRWLEPIQKVF
jgi:hypothetical protein